MATSKQAKKTVEIENRKARFDYHIDETFEAGIVLKGTEVKSIRAGEASLVDSYAWIREDEVWITGMYIKHYAQGSYANVDERRDRKLLLHKKEIVEIEKGITRKGYTVVPLKLYFKTGKAKILLGMAKGKKQYDKRETIRAKDEQRDLDRKLKGAK